MSDRTPAPPFVPDMTGSTPGLPAPGMIPRPAFGSPAGPPGAGRGESAPPGAVPGDAGSAALPWAGPNLKDPTTPVVVPASRRPGHGPQFLPAASVAGGREPAGGSPAAPAAPAPDLARIEAERRADAERHHRELALAVAAARAEGRAEGHAAGHAEARTSLATSEQALAATVVALREQAAPWLDAMEANVGALAIAVARQLIGATLDEHPERVAEFVRRALRLAPLDGTIRVRLAPEDAALAREAVERYATDAHATIQIIADPTQPRGGALVETPTRVIDGRIEPALARLYAALATAPE